jgi:hypothetical protein
MAGHLAAHRRAENVLAHLADVLAGPVGQMRVERTDAALELAHESLGARRDVGMDIADCLAALLVAAQAFDQLPVLARRGAKIERELRVQHGRADRQKVVVRVQRELEQVAER